MDDDGPDLFGYISDLALDGLGRAWVFEGHSQELRVFAPDGSHVRTVGGRGEGPGEFSNVAGLVWGPGGDLWTIDQRLGRISVFDTTGHFTGSYPTQGFFQVSPWPGGFDVEDRFYDVRSNPDLDAPDFLVRFDADLQPLDTLLLPEHPDGPQVFSHRSDNGFVQVGIPFSGRAAWLIAPDGGFWVFITDRYQILRIGPGGDTLRIISKPFEPVPVQPEELEELLEQYAWFKGDIDRSRIPEVRPAISRAFQDDEGHLWVIPDGGEESVGRSAEVFDSTGVFLGALDLPFPVTGYQTVIRSNTLLTVTRDSLGVPYVRRMAIQKPTVN